MPRGSFPSLSGKTSIRTEGGRVLKSRAQGSVSIPFREDLYSDVRDSFLNCFVKLEQFPSLSGKTSIRTIERRVQHTCDWTGSFHPFQGRPLFGPIKLTKGDVVIIFQFPSLSGKTSIRTRHWLCILGGRPPRVSIPFREDLYSDRSRQQYRRRSKA